MEYSGTCPYCNIEIIVEKLNCCIMRCGIYQLKNRKWRQMPKHGRKEQIKKIINNYKIFGCGNPIKYDKIQKKIIKSEWNS
jgi:hypothetical protein